MSCFLNREKSSTNSRSRNKFLAFVVYLCYFVLSAFLAIQSFTSEKGDKLEFMRTQFFHGQVMLTLRQDVVVL